MFIGPVYAQTPNYNQKWAYLVGMSDYQYFDDLHGHDDLIKMNDILLKYGGFNANHIFKAFDQTATKSKITKDLKDLASEHVNPDDLFLFYFSGHGNQIVDKDSDESDGADESLCTYESDESSQTQISDDELQSMLKTIKAKTIVCILDSCHSGGFIADLAKKNSSKYVIVTGCKEDETSSEDPIIDGYLTHYLIQGLTENSDSDLKTEVPKSDITNETYTSVEEAFNYAAPLVTERESTQHPQIFDGNTGQEVELSS